MKVILPRRTIEQDAVRILFILHFCGEPLPPQLPYSSDPKNSCVKKIDSETKLQKLDFWIRYPDYLCLALLRAYTEGHRSHYSKENCIKNIIRCIVENEEPKVKLQPMLRYLRGAYEPLDIVMSFLYSRDLIRPYFKKVNTNYELTQRGEDTVNCLLEECTETLWYAERCKLLNQYFGFLNGCDIRDIQYQEPEYKDTVISELIMPISEDRIRDRFQQVFGEPL